jgi:outer membrane immunogenic protein
MKRLATAIAAIALIGTPAFAADMAVKMPVKAPPPAPAPVVSWTGFYVGGNIGGVVEHFQAGYNWQFNPQWLVGVEGDWDWTNTGYSFCRQTNQLSAPCFNNGFGFESISSKTDWLATVRGRLGFVWGNWLFYGTGGAAWGRVNTTATLNCLGALAAVAIPLLCFRGPRAPARPKRGGLQVLALNGC